MHPDDYVPPYAENDFGCDIRRYLTVRVRFWKLNYGETVSRLMADRFSEKRSSGIVIWGKAILMVSFFCDGTPTRVEYPRPRCTEGMLRRVRGT